MNFRASPVFFEQAASMLQSLQSLNSLYGSQPGSSISSSESAFSASKLRNQSAFSKTKAQSEDDDCEIIFYEPVKKIKGGESTVNLVGLSPQKGLSPSTQPDNGYNSSSSLSEALVDKDAIELEDDDEFQNLPYEQLVMEDDVTRDLRKLREQVEKLSENKETAEIVEEEDQSAFMATQQRAYMQQVNASNYMAAMLYNAKVNYVRQMQAQVQAQALSLLGKRLYEQFEGFSTQTRAGNYIVLDDEQSNEERIVEEKLMAKKNVFKITKEVRKMAPKKVFTIIRQKPRVHRKIVIPRRMSLMASVNITEKVQTSTVTTSTEKQTTENKMQIEQQPQKLTTKTSQKEEKVETQKKKKEVKRDDGDEYVIKLHVGENDDSDEINETPVGEEFQVKVGPFVENARAKKELKLVWDPSKATERNVGSYFQKLETKFGKKIVSEEFALKAYYEHKMNVKKIMSEIEGNKLYFKNFFEMKAKVLRNRVLHNDF